MFTENRSVQIRRELIKKITKLFFAGEIEQKADKIAVEMFPKHSESPRCCIYKARAIVKYRLMALFGFGDEEETDETATLEYYYKNALTEGNIKHPLLTVIDEACSSCVKINYFATNACRGCVARPCISACPKDAIHINAGQSVIDSKKCVNCGKCMKVCPYHAIVYIPVPCEEACPVNAISKNEHQKECIDFSKCIYCGKCINKCPFGAIMEKSQILDALNAIRSGAKVIAMLAPSVMGHFDASLGKIVTAVKKIGFYGAVEVASGADLTSENEALEFSERIGSDESFITSSCCYSYIELIEKHITGLKRHFSTTKTPMIFSAELVKKEHPDAVTVFISPCVSKKSEALKSDAVDFVVSIEELGSIMEALDISPENCEEELIEKPATPRGRGFAASGGVMAAMDKVIRSRADAAKISGAEEGGRNDGAAPEIAPIYINGISRQSIKELKGYAENGCGKSNFIEVMSCEGGCVNGPCVINPPLIAQRKYKEFNEVKI